MKVCTKCKIEKSLEEFSLKKTHVDGRASRCKECINTATREYVRNNKDKIKARRAELFELDPEKYRTLSRNGMRRWRLNADNKHKQLAAKKIHDSTPEFKAKRLEYLKNNPDKAETNSRWSRTKEGKEYKRRWKNENKAKVNASYAKRRAIKLQATPPWVDKDHFNRIEEIYRSAKTLTEFHEEPYHVDHIEPLQGKTSCGLHVYWNLRPLPARENLSKANKLENQPEPYINLKST